MSRRLIAEESADDFFQDDIFECLNYIFRSQNSASLLINQILGFLENKIINKFSGKNEFRNLLIAACFIKFEKRDAFDGATLNYDLFGNWLSKLLFCDEFIIEKFDLFASVAAISLSDDGIIKFPHAYQRYSLEILDKMEYPKNGYHYLQGITPGQLHLIILNKLYHDPILGADSKINPAIIELENKYLTGLSIEKLINVVNRFGCLYKDRELKYILKNIVTDHRSIHNDSSRRMAETQISFLLFQNLMEHKNLTQLVKFCEKLDEFIKLHINFKHYAYQKIANLIPEKLSPYKQDIEKIFRVVDGSVKYVITGHHLQVSLLDIYGRGIYSRGSRSLIALKPNSILSSQCDLFLIKSFDVDKVKEIKQKEAVLLTDENSAFLIHSWEIVMDEDKPFFVNNVNRHSLPLCDSKSPVKIEAIESSSKIIQTILLRTDLALISSYKSGILRSWDPSPFFDPSIGMDVTNPHIEDRSPDRSIYDDADLPFTKDLFSKNIHPFVNSISGTLLCLVRLYIVYYYELNSIQKSQSLDKDFFIYYLKLMISMLHALEGGHCLYEFFSCLNVPEIHEEIQKIYPGIKLDMETLFCKENHSYSSAIRAAASHAKILFYKKNINQQIKTRGPKLKTGSLLKYKELVFLSSKKCEGNQLHSSHYQNKK